MDKNYLFPKGKNMSTVTSTFPISPRVGALLTQVTETPDLETALWRVLSDYLVMKISSLRERTKTFEEKWSMTFTEFSEEFKTGTLSQNSYDYEVESDYWEWEKAETLLEHYINLRSQWT